MEFKSPGLRGSFRLVEFTPKDAPEALWHAYLTLSEVILHEFHPRDRLQDREVVRRLLSSPSPLYQTRRWLLIENGQNAAGSVSISYDTEISPDYESNPHACQVRIAVAAEWRRKKIASRLLRHLIEIADLMGKDTVMGEVDNPAGMGFCRHFMGERVHEEVTHRLYMEDVDWELTANWLMKGRTKAHDTKIELFQECPESDIEEFCTLYTEVINQRPIGDMDQALLTTPESRRVEERTLKRKGLAWYTMISRESDGRISGLTDIIYNPQEPHRMSQYLTGVLKRYRRRGLAKRLKAEMLVFISKRFPDVEHITTSVARTNRPMRAINKQMGFMPRRSCFTFRWPLEDLRRRVDEVLSARGSRDRFFPLRQ